MSVIYIYTTTTITTTYSTGQLVFKTARILIRNLKKDPYQKDPYQKDPYQKDPYQKDPYQKDRM